MDRKMLYFSFIILFVSFLTVPISTCYDIGDDDGGGFLDDYNLVDDVQQDSDIFLAIASDGRTEAINTADGDITDVYVAPGDDIPTIVIDGQEYVPTGDYSIYQDPDTGEDVYVFSYEPAPIGDDSGDDVYYGDDDDDGPTCNSCQYLSGGSCRYYCSGTSTSCGCTSCTDCTSLEGWYDVDESYVCCDGQSLCNCQNQEYKRGYCWAYACELSVTDTRTVKTNCASCGTDGWYDVGASYKCCEGQSRCDCQDQEYRAYGCSGDTCGNTVTDTRTVKTNCASCGTDGWYCDESGNDTREYRDYICSSGTCGYDAPDTCECECSGCSGGACVRNCVSSDTNCGCDSCENCNSHDEDSCEYRCNEATSTYEYWCDDWGCSGTTCGECGCGPSECEIQGEWHKSSGDIYCTDPDNWDSDNYDCDCDCGSHDTDESYLAGNCYDTKDNDCDLLPDEEDPGCGYMNMTIMPELIETEIGEKVSAKIFVSNRINAYQIANVTYRITENRTTVPMANPIESYISESPINMTPMSGSEVWIYARANTAGSFIFNVTLEYDHLGMKRYETGSFVVVSGAKGYGGASAPGMTGVWILLIVLASAVVYFRKSGERKTS